MSLQHRILVVYNPESGNQTGKEFVDSHVLPLLSQHSAYFSVENVVATEHDAGKTVARLLRDDHLRTNSESDLSLVLASGDGTLHELISSLALDAGSEGAGPEPRPFHLHIALVPTGTANALYSSLFPPPKDEQALQDPAYKLQSLQSLINSRTSGKVTARSLTLGVATLSSPPSLIPTEGASRQPPQTAISCVVASTSFHAYILHDSEQLRAEHPTIDRFKIAAKQNTTQWTHASVKLFPSRNGRPVQIYNPDTKQFVDASSVTSSANDPEDDDDDEDDNDDIVDLEGPFAYFVSTINVDRLEPNFRIAPLQSTSPPAANNPTCDLIIVRPDRDPSFSWDTPEFRSTFAEKIWKVLNGAYQDGVHVDFKYAEDGSIVPPPSTTSTASQAQSQGPSVVEYYRCAGWEWYPDPGDEKAHLVCVDGSIRKIAPNGRAVFTAVAPAKNSGFSIFD